jgi:hypothetical protein
MVMLTKPVGAPAIKSVTGPEAEDVDMPPQWVTDSIIQPARAAWSAKWLICLPKT